MFDVCFLHIGFEKTGTSSIQQFLHRNRNQLAQRGYYHPLSLDVPNNTYLYVYAAEEERINEVHRAVRQGLSPEEFRAKVERDLEMELSGRSGTLVLSNEHLHSEVRSHAGIERLKRLIEPYCKKIVVVAYLRRQDRTAISQYSTALKSGMDHLPRVLGFPRADAIDYYYDYALVLENYASVFGREQMEVRVFEPELLTSGNAVLDFAGAIGLGDFAWLEMPSVANASLRPIALRFLAEVNKRLPVLHRGGANPARARLIRAIEQHYSGGGPTVLRSEAEAYFQAFAETNERVRAEYFPSRTALFSDDFSMYPVKAPDEKPLTFEDAARMAAILWASSV
ncbi:MAG: hypothetical protein GC190_18445 [Alphaproteobacteria bacterium]|nr:hypothetical protein [Alphaproteobacteria bacterium]